VKLRVSDYARSLRRGYYDSWDTVLGTRPCSPPAVQLFSRAGRFASVQPHFYLLALVFQPGQTWLCYPDRFGLRLPAGSGESVTDATETVPQSWPHLFGPRTVHALSPKPLSTDISIPPTKQPSNLNPPPHPPAHPADQPKPSASTPPPQSSNCSPSH